MATAESFDQPIARWGLGIEKILRMIVPGRISMHAVCNQHQGHVNINAAVCLEFPVEIPVVGVRGDLDDALAPRRLKRFPVHGGG